MSDRIACVNPRCRRTFKREPGDADDSETCCGKCWRLLPAALTRRYKQLRRRYRKIDRLHTRVRRHRSPHVHGRQVFLIDMTIRRQFEANWTAIRNFFRPVDKPEGLDAFLEEVGL